MIIYFGCIFLIGDNMVNVGIIGATGYAGAELVRLLLGHSEVKIKYLASKSYAGQDFTDIYRNMFRIISEPLVSDDIESMSKDVDVIFTATPQGYLSSIISESVLENSKIIDLSADFRLKSVDTYESWYKIEHKSPNLIEKAVYGLCEIYRDDIKNTRLLANPGCYTTCSILALYPLVKEKVIDTSSIIIDAKSGTSGAGRGAKTDNLFCEVNENIKAYGIANHRHTPEIEQEMSFASGDKVTINFTPHLIPMNRGILATSYANLKDSDISYADIRAIYEKYYKNEYFVRILNEGKFPETRFVEGSNFTDIGFTIDKRTNRVIVVSALDNLIKGAAGQAVQNMNIMCGFIEGEGLVSAPIFP